MLKKIRVLRIILTVMLLAAAMAAAYAWKQSDLTWDELWPLLSEQGWRAVIVVLGLFLLKTVIWPIPLKGLYIGAGLLFSPLVAVAVSYAGLIIQLTVGFYMGRSMGETVVRPLLEQSKFSTKMLAIADENAIVSCFLLRFIPGPPTDLTNMFLGTLDVQFMKYLMVSVAAITPTLVPVVFIGDAVLNPLSVEFLIPFAASALVVGSTLIVRKIISNHYANDTVDLK